MVKSVCDGSCAFESATGLDGKAAGWTGERLFAKRTDIREEGTCVAAVACTNEPCQGILSHVLVISGVELFL